jgi:hypothetical protein
MPTDKIRRGDLVVTADGYYALVEENARGVLALFLANGTRVTEAADAVDRLRLWQQTPPVAPGNATVSAANFAEVMGPQLPAECFALAGRDVNPVELAAAAIANARGMRRGAPPIANILDALPPKLRAEVLEDAAAALDAVRLVRRQPGPAGQGGVAVDVNGCARCGGRHEGLMFRPLANPPGAFRHWAACPATGDPILMADVTPEDAAALPEPSALLAELEAIAADPQPVALEIDKVTAFVVLQGLTLALGHPGAGQLVLIRDPLVSLARKLERAVATTPALAAMAEYGWGRAGGR